MSRWLLEKNSASKLTESSSDEFEGDITAIDSRFDESTRNIMIQGTVANTETGCVPGCSSMSMCMQPEQDVISIPATSISYAPYGDSVFVVKDVQGADGKPIKEALQQFVKTGPTRGRSGVDHFRRQGGRRSGQFRCLQIAQWDPGAGEQQRSTGK